jgi:hypothetical protein
MLSLSAPLRAQTSINSVDVLTSVLKDQPVEDSEGPLEKDKIIDKYLLLNKRIDKNSY